MTILAIAFKDLTRSFRSLFAVGMMVIAPLLLIGLIYFAFSGALGGDAEMPAISVGFVNADSLPADAPLDQPLGENIRSMFFDESVRTWLTARDFSDEAAVRAALNQREIGVAVIVPAGFTGQLLAGGEVAPVRVLSDPTLTIAPQVVENMVTAMLDGVTGGGIAIQTVIERQQAQGVQPEPAKIPAVMEGYAAWYAAFQRDLFHHPEKSALALAAPAAQGGAEEPMLKMLGMMMAGQMVFFAFFSGAYAMMSILQENEEGTLARMFTMPVERVKILAGKFLAVFLLVVVQGIVLIVAARFAFGIRWGDPLPVVLALSGQVAAATGLGALLISFVQTSRQGGPVLGGGLTALGMLGGLFTANINMPEAFTRLAFFTPQGWVIQGWKIVLNGQPLADLVLPLGVMLAMGAVMFAIGAVRFGKRFA